MSLFFYSVHEIKEAAYRSELKRLEERLLNFRFHLVESSLEGRLFYEKIQSQIKNLENREIFLCGPIQMNKSLFREFLSHGISSSQIYYEDFSFKKSKEEKKLILREDIID